MMELKPCPFCGEKDVNLATNPDTLWWSTECFNCNASIGDFYKKEQAIEAWNRRENEKA